MTKEIHHNGTRTPEKRRKADDMQKETIHLKHPLVKSRMPRVKTYWCQRAVVGTPYLLVAGK
jgi:hypothetical protein